MSTGDLQPTMLEDGLIASADGLSVSVVRVVPPTTAFGYGVDLVCTNDLDPALAETDPLATATLGQAAFHRITTRRGTLPDDPDYGIDVAAFLHTPHTPADLLALAGQIGTELVKDDRFADASAVVTYDATFTRLNISVRIVPKDPALESFTLIVAVTDGLTLLVEILS